MTNWYGLTPGDTIYNDQLRAIFQCSPQGGMRRSLKKNALVLISNHVESTYDDRWINDVLHYTGMGMKDDQSLEFMQNKTLNESKTNGVDLFLFEVYKEKQYTYRGRVELAQTPYQEEQLDENKNVRKVWIFPLRLIGEDRYYHPAEIVVQEAKAVHERKAKRMSMDDLKQRAKHARKTSSRREGTVTTYDRDPYVTEYAKRRANGKCQLCEQPAPFKNKKNEPYLETHHVQWLARGGEDSIENTVALCPNCHKKMHVLDLPTDVAKLTSKAREEILHEAG
ncbi:HNH endonuclease [Paenibacillus rigui]|uniref:Restriction endonuclease n=1 Tax=Paenibacillus rigui TaxID=554312 RepID=A0A229UQY4_9BACL|nr:HNH endonuclease [Paenibacillus rigui]OXM85810.1 restriction endonuclease [Paenibacillus rigui]